MSTETFSFKDYSLSPVDLIPADDDLDDEDFTEADERSARYARLGRLVDVDDVIEMVCSRLKESAQLRSVVEDAIADPHDPDRPHIHVSGALRLTNDVLVEVVTAVDDLISMLDVTTDEEVA